MGLTFHYNGRIVDKNKLPQLIEELEEISKVHEWKYHIFETKFPIGYFPDDVNDGNLYGISMNPPECEPVAFSFTNDGRLCSPGQFSCWGNSTDEKERKYLYMNSTKTQYAGPEIHKMVIGIFRYIVPRYLTDFKMVDESEFWETGDEELLEENFRRNNALIEGFHSALVQNQIREGENVESYLERVIKEYWERTYGSDIRKES